jgi:rfaE bifunctional protein nucleotidyltransferase chain/domain
MNEKLDRTNWRMRKIISLEEAKKTAAELRAEGKKLVTVNGAFDILHAGHLDQLEEARKQGDVLFVGINSDKSIHGYKGKERPFVTEQARAAMLAALCCVDYVIIIDEEVAEVQNTLLRTVHPNIHANGEEYGSVEQWIEWPVMQEIGTAGYVIRKRNDFSTTGLIERIRRTRS